MKKAITFVLCIFVVLSITVPCFAVNLDTSIVPFADSDSIMTPEEWKAYRNSPAYEAEQNYKQNYIQTRLISKSDLNGDGEISESESNLWARFNDIDEKLDNIETKNNNTLYNVINNKHLLQQIRIEIFIVGIVLICLILATLICNIALLLKYFKLKKTLLKSQTKQVNEDILHEM